jgi:uncharacterized protein YgiM (DUF1202 family)
MVLGIPVLATAALFARVSGGSTDAVPETGRGPGSATDTAPVAPGSLMVVVQEPLPAEPRQGGQFPADDGQRYMVQGVVAPDTLNVRREPDPRSGVVGKIPAGARGVIVTARRRQVGSSVWWNVAYQGRRGWANSRFLVPEGPGHTDGPPPRTL